ncbi:MAG: peptidase M1 [Cytophagales bacterium CG18_big_fil_WC_8_21_14_2_50_42_9]|nr:MAG: peptidase M1 [Cytophagales bacterium CG18_big_fil_WC_8_21_14_2_50_42_9]
MKNGHSLIKSLLFLLLLLSFFKSSGQDRNSALDKSYKGASQKTHNIISTKLDIGFVMDRQILVGKAWLTIQPYSKSENYLDLDGKGMVFKKVSIRSGKKYIPANYVADDRGIKIDLDKSYGPTEQYKIYIEYETKPASSLVSWQSALHFINPKGDQKDTPTQIWTSGQPENNSSWFPTIDKPNQKIRQEISITVPVKFSTLSNGKLISKQILPQGLRKDTWKMNLPHAPYLFMFAVGEFNIVKDHWKKKEVSYYVEPQFSQDEKAVRNAFPNTVEAINYFSKLLGVPYPWDKYSQIKLREFSGAMEHTTATSFNEDKQSSARELMDKNYEPGNIHELFHQWFGNYVTAESWANICLNESFADLSEIIWAEHKFGNDVAGDHLLKGMRGYLSNQDGWDKTLVRFDYENPQEVFDGISYQKGGRILNMLRKYLGDVIFYKGLNLYLTRNANQSAEVHDLRLALEATSGMDLNWFFNQWFFGSGHPELDIQYEYGRSGKQSIVIIKQTQKSKLFKIPIKIDLYFSDGKTTNQIWLTKAIDTIKFNTHNTPLLINVDAEKVLIAKKTDHKTLAQYAYQYANAPLFQDRYEAVEAATENQGDQISRKILSAALHDKFYSIRIYAINSINFTDTISLKTFLPDIIVIAQSDLNNSTRAAAINKLGKLKNKKYLGLFTSLLADESYLVSGEALNAIGEIDLQQQFQWAKTLQADSKGKLKQVIIQSYITMGQDAEWEYVYAAYSNGSSPFQYAFTRQLADFIKKIENSAYSQDGIRAIKEIVTIQKNRSIAPRVIMFLNEIKQSKEKLNDTASIKVIEESIMEISRLESNKY